MTTSKIVFQRLQPVNPQASPEARKLLEFLYSISGKKTLSGQHNYPGTQPASSDRAKAITGKTPAIWGQDFGFTAEGKDGINHRAANLEEALRRHQEGSIITLMWHAVRPTDEESKWWKENRLLWERLGRCPIPPCWTVSPDGFGS